MIAFTIAGAPRTKKTHNNAHRTGAPCRCCGMRRGHLRVGPSPQYVAWAETFTAEVLRQRLVLKLSGPLTVRALFYRDRAIGDLTGYLQALGDALQKAGVIENDRQILSWDGSRLLKDAAHPRVEVEIGEC